MTAIAQAQPEPSVSEIRHAVLANGYRPIPVKGKIPRLKGWQSFEPTASTIDAWSRGYADHTNTGILAGEVVAIDIDAPDIDAAEKLISALLDIPGATQAPCRTGRAPKCLFIFRATEPRKKVATPVYIVDGEKCPGPEIMRMLEAGFKFRRQPLLLMITNSGSDRLSVCWREHEMACKVAAGTETPDTEFEYVGETWDGSDALFSYVCALDPDDDPFEDPTCWIKTNPLLGVTIQEEYIASQVAFARNFPSDAPGILRLYFCVWTDAHSSWMPRTTVASAMAPFDPSDHEGKPVFLGVDLSSHQDMTCVAYVVPTGHKEMTRPDGTTFLAPTFDAWVDSFTPADTLKQRAELDKAPYLQWVDDKHLQAIPGERIRYDYVAYSVAQADKRFDIKAVAYDQYAYAEFREECGALGLDLVHRSHPQGGLRRNAPDEALIEQAKADGLPEPGGLWMPGSIREVESLIIDGRIRLRDNPLLMAGMMAAAFSPPDPLGNKYLLKSKSHKRIDSVIALCMAVGAAVDGAAEPPKRQYQMMVFG